MSSPSEETIFPKDIAVLPEPRPINVLHVDDEPDFADLTAIYLERESIEIEVITADSVEEGLGRLETDAIDCIVSDYDMPHRNGLDFLAIVREEYPEMPFILFTGKGSEEIASEAISAGVTDYLQKEIGTDQFTVLANRIQNAARQYKTDREIERMGIALQTVDAGIAFLNEDGQFIYVNPEYGEVLGYSSEELTGQPIDMLYPDELLNQVYEDILPTVPQEGEWTGESIHIHKDGTRLIVSQRFSYCSAGMLLCFILNVTTQNGIERRPEGVEQTKPDITEQMERDQQLERERDRFQAVFEESFDAMVIADDDGLYLDANESATTLFGMTEEELLGRSIAEFAPDDFDFDAAWSEFQNSESDRGTFPLVRPDGTKRTVEYAATRDIVPGQHLSILRDITERIERDQELQIRTKQLQDIFDIVEAAMWVRNKDGEYEFMNQYHRDLFDIADDVEVAGKQFSDLLPAEVVEQFQQNDQRVYETEEPIEIEETVETDDGQRDFLTRIIPLFEDGSVYATCGIATDITEQKNRERQLEQFASIVSHDLRNPLTVASGRLDLASEECDSEHLEAIGRAHDRMELLIEDLLTLAQEGAMIAETTSVDLELLVEGCWANVETVGTTLVVDIERSVQADESRLQQVFENLVRNAIEHGGDDVTITIGELDDGFYIEDDGPGIPEDEREDIFEAGYSTSDEGTGFGLSIVKEVTEAHGWKIRVTDGTDGGARFEITGVEFVDV